MAQMTSDLWKDLWSRRNVKKQYQFDVNGTIYGSDEEISHSVDHELFEGFGFGNATVAKLTLSVVSENIPRGAVVKRFVRLIDGEEVSEWLPAGVFFTNRRAVSDDVWTIEAFDAMRKADAVWEPDQTLVFPLSATSAVSEFAQIMGVEIDSRTALNPNYFIDYPANDYTIRDELKFIAAMHGGNWIIGSDGRLRLVPLIPSGLVHEVGQDIVYMNDNGLRQPVSRVTLRVDDETELTSGTDVGLELIADCPYATQPIVDSLFLALSGYEYRAYVAGAVEIDPAAELGDLVSVDGVNSFIAAVSDNGDGYPDISAPGEREIDDEYPDAGPIQREFNRKIAKTRAEIAKTVESITLSVTNDENGTSSRFELKSGETVLSSGNITFDGYVTFKGLEDGTTTIDGGCIKTGEILADLIKAGVLQSKDGETFVLDLDNGTFSMKGSGKFQSPNGRTYITVDGDEMVMYSLNEKTGEYIDKIHFGFISGDDPSDVSNTLDYPYMLLGKSGGNVGMIKEFYNGLFIGNSVPKNASGNFEGMVGASGIFVNTRTGKTYVVHGTDMQSVYTGEAIAKFG